jgi:hypothetical protein
MFWKRCPLQVSYSLYEYGRWELFDFYAPKFQYCGTVFVGVNKSFLKVEIVAAFQKEIGK